jgi:hypothetical protein
MPPPVVVVAGTIVRYTFKHTLRFGNKADTVMDISIDSQGAFSRDGIVDDFNSHVAGYWQDTALGIFGTTSAFNGAHWIDLDTPSGRTGFLGPAGGHPVNGGTAGGFLPPNSAYLFHKNGIASRGQRQGRTYIPDVPEASVGDDGLIDPTVLAAKVVKMEQWRTTVGNYERVVGSGLHPVAVRIVHVHKPDKTDSTTWTWSSTTCDSFTGDPKIATQRRRLR